MFRKNNKQENRHENIHSGNVVFLHKGELLEGRIFGEGHKTFTTMVPEYVYNILADGKIYQNVRHHEIEPLSTSTELPKPRPTRPVK